MKAQLALKCAVIVAFVTGLFSNAFRSPMRKAVTRDSLRMAIIDPDMPGQLPPLGYFDPLGLAEGTNDKIFKRWRESEIKHGRLAMVAAIGILTAEVWHPFYGGLIRGPAISHFQQIEALQPGFWLVPLLATGIFEAYSIAKGWAPPDETKGTVAWLKDDYVPGDLGWDRTNITPLKYGKWSPEFIEMRNRELQNGRLAMIAVAGVIAQELVDGKTVFEHLFGY